jgi:hypothetical protein
MMYLKNILLLNAVSSGATGIGLIVFARFIADIFGVQQLSPFYGTGIFLVVFAAFVGYESLQKPIRTGRVQLISMLDNLWVLASMSIVLLGLFNLTLIGYGLITGVAFWVAAMAYLQVRGIKQLAA